MFFLIIVLGFGVKEYLNNEGSVNGDNVMFFFEYKTSNLFYIAEKCTYQNISPYKLLNYHSVRRIISSHSLQSLVPWKLSVTR